MKKMSIIIMVAFMWPCTSALKAQTADEIAELSSLLQQEHYVTLVNRVCTMRQNEYYKNAFMDYCLAYGYCHLNRPTAAVEWFDHLLLSYNSLTPSKRAELINLKTTCQHPETVSSTANEMMEFLRTMNPEGFTGNQGGIESKMGIPSLSDRVTEVDFEHATFNTENHQYNQQQKSEACSYYKGLLNDSAFTCDSTEHLLFFYSKNDMDIKSQMNEMERYYQYYSDAFNLGESNRLITMFYCSSRNVFNNVAKKVHHMEVPGTTYGYASSADLVMLGIANVVWLGAMKHELFHLMIRSFVGDVPAWMDEGIACYFESSSIKDGVANVNMRNYRTNIFEELHTMRRECEDKLIVPTVDQFTNYNWLQYSGNPGDLMIKTSLNYSISYVFIKFLSDQNKLEAMVDAFRDRTYSEVLTSSDDGEPLTILHVRPSNEILISVLGMDIQHIQSAFESWCLTNLNVNPYKVH